MALLMGMGSTAFTTRDVITIKHPLYLKWKMNIIVDVGQITLRKVFLG